MIGTTEDTDNLFDRSQYTATITMIYDSAAPIGTVLIAAKGKFIAPLFHFEWCFLVPVADSLSFVVRWRPLCDDRVAYYRITYGSCRKSKIEFRSRKRSRYR
jgi:hypothetical protein